MKKLLSLALVAGMFSFYACGPSAEDKAAAEKAEQDSIAAAQDMIKAAEEAAMMNAAADSAAAADTTAMPADTTK